MGKCDRCGEEENWLFTCPICKGRFCLDHKNPENHACSHTKKQAKNAKLKNSNLVL